MKEKSKVLKIWYKYFLSVQTTQWIYFVYSIVLPIIMIFGSLNYPVYNNKNIIQVILPWIGFITYNNAITSNSDVINLREQGYIKQYKTLISSPYILVFSKHVVWFTMQLIEVLIISIVSYLFFGVNLIANALILSLVSLISFFPLAFLFQFLYIMPLSTQTITVFTYIATTIIFFFAFESNKSSLINSFNPILFFRSCFDLITSFSFSRFFSYLFISLILSFIGLIGYKKMNTSPIEGY